GREEDRGIGGSCSQWCDTDFVGGYAYPDAPRLALAIKERWPGGARPFVVLTGGEPTLQATDQLVLELKALRFEVAMESNGTKPAPAVDWLTVSPKAGTEVVQRSGQELKVVWPQQFNLDELATWRFEHFLLSPMDGFKDSARAAAETCMRN